MIARKGVSWKGRQNLYSDKAKEVDYPRFRDAGDCICTVARFFVEKRGKQ